MVAGSWKYRQLSFTLPKGRSPAYNHDPQPYSPPCVLLPFPWRNISCLSKQFLWFRGISVNVRTHTVCAHVRRKNERRRRGESIRISCGVTDLSRRNISCARRGDRRPVHFVLFPFLFSFRCPLQSECQPASCNESKCAGEDIELARYIVHSLSLLP